MFSRKSVVENYVTNKQCTNVNELNSSSNHAVLNVMREIITQDKLTFQTVVILLGLLDSLAITS